VAGGIAVVAAVLVVIRVAFIVLDANRKGGSVPVLAGNDLVLLADPGVELGGPWPEPVPPAGVSAPSETSLTVRVVLVGVSFRNTKSAVADLQTVQKVIWGAERPIMERIRALAEPGTRRISASDDDATGDNRRMTVRLDPVKTDAQSFAKRIDFGTVQSVVGRTVTVIVRKGEEPPPK
jgi:hypothetical protein